MDLVASVSRSSGLEKDGDTLKDYKIQEEYLQFVEEKLAKLGPLADVERTDKRRNEEENILILFRKLREGVSSSNRQDAFALQVYEMSLFLSAIFESSKQLNSVIPQLAPLYQSTSSHPQSCRLAATLVSLVHYLVDSYPLQGVYQQHLDSIPSSFFPASSEAWKWMSALSKALRTHNYIGFEALSRSEAISSFCKDDGKMGVLAKPALLTTIEALRRKSRDTTWTILRSSYREWSCQPDYDVTRDWLERCLALRSVLDTAKDVSVEAWLRCREKEGHVRPKDGVEGRWLVYRQK
ncbi:hypothetical protein ONZ45_g19182 [Pleurotus djamor]|nr:hypothetical protein ONZ45_g19182 [Pleurotus djamor]